MDHVITGRLIDRITGRGPEQQTLYGNTPSRRCFAGVVASQYRFRKAQAEDDSFQNFGQDVAPFSLGLTFQVDSDELDDAEFEFQPNLKLFYRRYPKYEEQLRYGELEEASYGELAVTNEDREVHADGGTATYDEQNLLRVFERLSPSIEPISVPGAEIRDAAKRDRRLHYDITNQLQAAREAYHGAERVYCESTDGVERWEADSVPAESLTDEPSFEAHLEEVFSETPKPVEWTAYLRITASQRDDGRIAVSVSLVNGFGEDYPNSEEPDEDWQSYLFDVTLGVEAGSPLFKSFPSEEIRDHYQYDGNIYAIGENCAVERMSKNPVTGLQTTTVPVYEQPKYHSRETVDAPFSELAHGDIDGVLANIEAEMDSAYEQYENLEDDILVGKTSAAQKEYQKTLRDFAAERERFHQGRELIANDPQVEKAFRALNETFTEMGEDYVQWRLFQIVFIVMTLPDIVAQADPERDIVDALNVGDVIYFPTGGGKTEAYLGLVVFAAFYDRLRGKEFGMTALTKFPLRLLSLQQLQRIADVLCMAETIRRDDSAMAGESFSVGYFVGRNNTPNKTYSMSDRGGDTNYVKEARDDPDKQQEWLMVQDCPYCDADETVSVTGDLERMRIIHQCENPECPEVQHQGGKTAELPIYITDEEVYRHAPTFVVSTIDKIAIVGWQRRMRTLFGRVKHRCQKHGLTSEEECFMADNSYPKKLRCDSADLTPVEPVDPPSILIQDELHLLREEFGAFDSHYETFIQELVNRYTDGRWQMKIVAATATIKGASSQVNALYWRDTNVFPTQGPRLRQSFYAYEDPYQLGRRMVGAIPRTISRTLAINSIIRERAMLVQELQGDLESDDLDGLDAALAEIPESQLGGPLDLPTDVAERKDIYQKLLGMYEVQVNYNIAKTKSDMLQRNVNQMLNEQLKAYGEPYHELKSVPLTGETDMDVVRDALARLESDNPDRPIDIVIATSMISHGVDIDKLNFISFFGMPRNTAEYIQAYSRVGRRYPGTVFVLFDAIRARDRSHYTKFEHYHRYQDLLVEATPLERWAQFAIDRTMPGLIVGLFLQYYHHEFEGQTEKSLYQFQGYNEALDRDLITSEDALEFIKRAYSVTEEQEQEWSDVHGINLYRERIKDQFDKVWDRLVEDPLGKDPREEFIANVVTGDAEDEHGPMNSLRDIDQQIDIIPNRYSTVVVESFKEGGH
ncbi:helicase-related protein [Haladaptatus sp. GCM10025707]